MRPPWMDPDVAGPTALCVTDSFARDALRWASDVPGKSNAPQVRSAYDEAKSWCQRCDVTDQCLAWALAEEGGDSHNRDGVYGGKDPAERAFLAGHASKAPAPPPALVVCGVCTTPFMPGSAAARYCPGACRKTALYRQQGDRRRQKRAEARAARAS